MKTRRHHEQLYTEITPSSSHTTPLINRSSEKPMNHSVDLEFQRKVCDSKIIKL